MGSVWSLDDAKCFYLWPQLGSSNPVLLLPCVTRGARCLAPFYYFKCALVRIRAGLLRRFPRPRKGVKSFQSASEPVCQRQFTTAVSFNGDSSLRFWSSFVCDYSFFGYTTTTTTINNKHHTSINYSKWINIEPEREVFFLENVHFLPARSAYSCSARRLLRNKLFYLMYFLMKFGKICQRD